MGYRCKITRYSSISGNTELEFDIPSRVTITGKEDHFARAVEDVNCIVSGLRALDRALENDKRERNGKIEEVTLRYDVKSLEHY